jgi:WD40 repeat protein
MRIICIGHTEAILCSTFLPDGRIASASFDGTIKTWNTQTGGQL